MGKVVLDGRAAYLVDRVVNDVMTLIKKVVFVIKTRDHHEQLLFVHCTHDKPKVVDMRSDAKA